jgi:hypothetical protein
MEVVASVLREQTHHRRESPDKIVFNPFKGGIEAAKSNSHLLAVPAGDSV